MKRVFIDTETTGLIYKKRSVIQIAAIMEIDGEEVGHFNEFMQPDWRQDIDQKALDVNGHTIQSLRGLPDPGVTWGSFKNWISKYIDPYDPTDKAFFLAYNSEFDYQFVRSDYSKYVDKYLNSFFYTTHIDIRALAAFYMQEVRDQMENFKLTTVCEFLSIPLINAHDGMADCRACKTLFDVSTRNWSKLNP